MCLLIFFFGRDGQRLGGGYIYLSIYIYMSVIHTYDTYIRIYTYIHVYLAGGYIYLSIYPYTYACNIHTCNIHTCIHGARRAAVAALQRCRAALRGILAHIICLASVHAVTNTGSYDTCMYPPPHMTHGACSHEHRLI
jgi:hypothetical protein